MAVEVLNKAGCTANVAKGILVSVNLLFWLSGAGVLGIAIYLMNDEKLAWLREIVSIDPKDPTLEAATIVLLSSGGFVILIGFLGFVGAIKEQPIMLNIYLTFLSIIIAAQLAVGIVVFIKKPEFTDILKTSLKGTVKNKVGEGFLFTAPWDYVQEKFQCCGSSGYEDYSKSMFRVKNQGNGTYVPDTCCKVNKAASSKDNVIYVDRSRCQIDASVRFLDTSEALNLKGCFEEITTWTSNNIALMAGLGFGLSSLELLVFLSACSLYQHVEMKRRQRLVPTESAVFDPNASLRKLSSKSAVSPYTGVNASQMRRISRPSEQN